ncbi:MAG: EAL domain-containing protein [Pseudomonadota bacterium]
MTLKSIGGKSYLVLTFFACIVGGYALAKLDFFEGLYAFTRKHEEFELDELICILLVSPLFFSALSWFRSNQLRQEVETRQIAEKEYAWLARHDVLTQLPNRRYIDDYSKSISGSGNGDMRDLTVIYIDLDRFKSVNDAYGHAIGDGVLREVASILKTIFDETELVARISGDEFVAILRKTKTDQELNRIARKILDRINRPMKVEEIVCQVGATIGIARRSTDGTESERRLETVIANADLAMTKAKQAGRNRHMFFEPQHRVEYLTDSKIAHELKAAINNREFDMVYQPQFDSKTLDVVGIEALVRWNHQTRGVLSPDSFLPQAEALNLLGAIDEVVLKKVIQDIEIWDSLGIRFNKIAVNISQQRLAEPDFLEKIERYKVGENSIAFELMESIFFDGDDQSIKEVISGIKELGCDVELDDFGTGHASIMSLSMIEPNCMKIDRDLVKPITESLVQRNLVGKIVEIAKSLNIRIVAEGVESLQHVEVLREMGCDTLQGYALARPMPSRELMDFCFSEKAAQIA